MKAVASRKNKKAHAPRPLAMPRGFYADLLTAQELRRLEPPASLDDELVLLRTCARRLLHRMLGDGEAGNDPKLLQQLVQIVRTIATVQRVKLMERGMDGGIAEQIRLVAGRLDPHRDL